MTDYPNTPTDYRKLSQVPGAWPHLHSAIIKCFVRRTTVEQFQGWIALGAGLAGFPKDFPMEQVDPDLWRRAAEAALEVLAERL